MVTKGQGLNHWWIKPPMLLFAGDWSQCGYVPQCPLEILLGDIFFPE